MSAQKKPISERERKRIRANYKSKSNVGSRNENTETNEIYMQIMKEWEQELQPLKFTFREKNKTPIR